MKETYYCNRQQKREQNLFWNDIKTKTSLFTMVYYTQYNNRQQKFLLCLKGRCEFAFKVESLVLYATHTHVNI